ncbi:MAG: HYR domain-containing protein [bacterium]|nr:HYR domain-containing protein [bacterium]
MKQLKQWKRMEKYWISGILVGAFVLLLLGIHTPVMAASSQPGPIKTMPVITTISPPSPATGELSKLATKDMEAIGDPTILAETIAGEGITISNVKWSGSPYSGGIFTGGEKIVGFESGIILSTMDIASLGKPARPGTVRASGQDIAKTSELPAVLEFDFVPDGSILTFEYVVSSKANKISVSRESSNAFGFFVNGVNYAPNGGLIDIRSNGVSQVLKCEAEVFPGTVNHLKLVIGGIGANSADTAVFIKANSVTTSSFDIYLSPQNFVTPVGNQADIECRVKKGSAPIKDALVFIEIVEGPNQDKSSGFLSTDDDGKVKWAYTTGDSGVDKIKVTVTYNNEKGTKSTYNAWVDLEVTGDCNSLIAKVLCENNISSKKAQLTFYLNNQEVCRQDINSTIVAICDLLTPAKDGDDIKVEAAVSILPSNDQSKWLNGIIEKSSKVEDKIPPQCIAKDITVKLDASGRARISPQDVDNGSWDNCGIAKMEVFPDTFTCDDAGKEISVTLTVTDTSDNESTCPAKVTVVDSIPPEPRCKDITVQLDASGQARISPQDVDNGSWDNCGIAKMEVYPDTFTCDNIGPNDVTFIVIDTSGNPPSICPATVTVVDLIPPEARCKDITVYLDASGQVSITPSDVDDGSTDNCGIAKMEVYPDTFTCDNIGCNLVTFIVIDTSGNPPSICLPTVTVVDLIPPEARCKDITVQLDASGQVSITPSDVDDGSTDNCGIAEMKVSPDTFTCDNIGPNEVTLTVTDTSGNQSTCTATVTVNDTEAPVPPLPLPPIIVPNDPTECSAIVPWDPPAFTDNCEVTEVTCTYPDGTPFDPSKPLPAECEDSAKGTLITCIAKDSSGNPASWSRLVIVLDKEPPMVSHCVDDISTSAKDKKDGRCGAYVSWDPPRFIDNCNDVTVTVIAVYPDDSTPHSVAPGDFFPLPPGECEGKYQIIYTGKDKCGNETKCSFWITVRDEEPPKIVTPCPDDIVVNNDPGQCGAVVTWPLPIFEDNCGDLTVTCNYNPGDFFPIPPGKCEGKYLVTCTATDKCGNKAECSFWITVREVEPPKITIDPPLKPKYFSTDKLDFCYTVTDNCDPNPEVTVLLSNNGGAPVDITAPSCIPIDLSKLVGHNVITIIAKDYCGNTSKDSVKFYVVLRLVGDQIVIKDEIQKLPNGTAFDAFIKFPAPYDALTIYRAVADGAPARSINRDWTEHMAICRFRRGDVTEFPVDDYFEVTGSFKYNGIDLEFFGADYIYRVLPPPRTPTSSPRSSTSLKPSKE